ncbi:alpha/beta fold hydrolase [Streptomyces sp. SID14436]|uniref:Prolyl oligopeptidase family serine peptidase n=2 Tax=unclassified Streptomyces TaxID=2593676 RepID=A0A6G3R2N2_9ACTN|nr:alpha/beta fold hydrolase [Streptomyces sp. SID14436]NEA89852.1 prolyl oligopeptidase family serine peptidase [Streptomyces sp. SID14436]
MRPKGTVRAVAGALLALTAGCTGGGGEAGPVPASVRPATGSQEAADPAAPSPSASARADPVSVPALIAREQTGSGLRLGRVLARTSAYTRYAVTYEANGLTVSGVMNIPEGDGPFPALVLAHGYIDPAVYVTGQGMPREHDLLARSGYVVLHVDYRNHAGSDKDPDNDVGLRLGYTEDVIGAALALRSWDRAEVDAGRIGLFGRSMGGGVVYNALVVAPGLFDAAVAHAPVSGRPEENLDHFQRPDGDPVVERIEAEHGTPEENPEFWRQVSPLTHAARAADPLQIHHGTADDTCPPRWSRAAAAAFEAAGADVELRAYAGEGHTFGPRWRESMDVTMDFFARHLR